MGGKVLILLRYVSALAVDIDRHEREVAFDAPSRCKVNFEPETIAAGRPGHTPEGGGFTGRQSRVSIQRNLKGDSPRGRAVGGRKCIVSLMRDSRPLHICRSMTSSALVGQLWSLGALTVFLWAMSQCSHPRRTWK